MVLDMDKNNRNTKPIISVVIPVYNMAEYLPQCLDSVLNQTLHDIEVICVDDGSTDTSLKILYHYQEQDARIVVLTQVNSGSGPARNNGIRYGNGQYVAFMDPDDWYPSNDVLESLYNSAIEHQVLVTGGSYCAWNNGHIITEFSVTRKKQRFYSDGLIPYSDYQFAFGFYRFIYKLDWIKKNELYFPHYIRGQDIPFFVNTLIKAQVFYSIKKETYCQRINHKKINWTPAKTNDRLQSLIDVIELSSTHDLKQLFAQTCIEYNSACFTTLVEKQYLNNPNIIDVLERFNAVVNQNIIETDNIIGNFTTSLLKIISKQIVGNSVERIISFILCVCLVVYYSFRFKGIKETLCLFRRVAMYTNL